MVTTRNAKIFAAVTVALVVLIVGLLLWLLLPPRPTPAQQVLVSQMKQPPNSDIGPTKPVGDITAYALNLGPWIWSPGRAALIGFTTDGELTVVGNKGTIMWSAGSVGGKTAVVDNANGQVYVVDASNVRIGKALSVPAGVVALGPFTMSIRDDASVVGTTSDGEVFVTA